MSVTTDEKRDRAFPWVECRGELSTATDDDVVPRVDEPLVGHSAHPMSTRRPTAGNRALLSRYPLAVLGALVVPLVAMGTVGATSPSPSVSLPIPTPAASIATGSVTWRPVDGALGGSLPGVTIGAGDAVAWTGGFAVLGDGVWLSTDGQIWTGHSLPQEIDGQESSLLTWRGGLLLIEQRPRERGWRFRLWSSADGREWRRAGTFDQRPVGRLDGCAFTYPHVVSTDARVLAMASCAPYANGRVRPRIAGRAGVAVRAEPSVPTWAWTSDDGSHWSRHLVTDDLDARGAGRDPVLVEAIGNGFAAILYGYPHTLWWSDDGASWTEISQLPRTVDEPSIWALGAIARDGRPERWLLMAGKVHATPSEGFTGVLGTLWTWDRTQWTEVVGRPDWQNGLIATDGPTAVAVTVKVLDNDPEQVRLDTLTSSDGGRAWKVSEGEELTPDECCLGGIALHGDRAVLAGPWGPDSTSVRSADISAGAP